MKRDAEYTCREVIERYCSVIGENTVLVKKSNGKRTEFECLGEPKCQKRMGGCRNERYLGK